MHTERVPPKVRQLTREFRKTTDLAGLTHLITPDCGAMSMESSSFYVPGLAQTGTWCLWLSYLSLLSLSLGLVVFGEGRNKTMDGWELS